MKALTTSSNWTDMSLFAIESFCLSLSPVAYWTTAGCNQYPKFLNVLLSVIKYIWPLELDRDAKKTYKKAKTNEMCENLSYNLFRSKRRTPLYALDLMKRIDDYNLLKRLQYFSVISGIPLWHTILDYCSTFCTKSISTRSQVTLKAITGLISNKLECSVW